MIVFLLLDYSDKAKSWSLIESRKQVESLKYSHLQEYKNDEFKEEEDKDMFGIMSWFLDESSKEW